MADLEATHVECVDHNEDAQECDGNAKLDLIVVSAKFQGLPLLKRHRLVNDCLADIMPKIHAVTMKTWTPEQYEAKK